MTFARPVVLLDFNFIKFIEIGFTFSIGFLSSRIIGRKRQLPKTESMADQPQDRRETLRLSPPQSSPAMLREIYEQPHALRQTIRRNVDGNTIFPAAFQSIGSDFSRVKKIIIA